MSVQDLVAQLQKKLELADPIPEESPGVYTFMLEDDTKVFIYETDEGYRLFSSFGEVPKDNREEFFGECLLANLFGAGTNGGILGLSPDGRKFHLTYLSENQGFVKFYEAVEDFANVLSYWKEEAKKVIEAGKPT